MVSKMDAIDGGSLGGRFLVVCLAGSGSEFALPATAAIHADDAGPGPVPIPILAHDAESTRVWNPKKLDGRQAGVAVLHQGEPVF